MDSQQRWHLLAVVAYSLKPIKRIGPCKRTQSCWPKIPTQQCLWLVASVCMGLYMLPYSISCMVLPFADVNVFWNNCTRTKVSKVSFAPLYNIWFLEGVIWNWKRNFRTWKVSITLGTRGNTRSNQNIHIKTNCKAWGRSLSIFTTQQIQSRKQRAVPLAPRVSNCLHEY